MSGTAHRATVCRRSGEQGAVAVEFALVLPILVALLMGITTAGLAYNRAIGLSNAVREGARFGATADASAAAPSWADNTVSRVRTTLFDDPSAETAAICVQLWRKGFGQLAGTCSPGSVSPSPTLPTNETAEPAVPSELPNGACVVRVIGARTFTVNIALVPAWRRINASYAVARYERTDKVLTCA